MKPKILAIILVPVILSGCEKKAELENRADPYLEAFWGQGIKTMVAYDPYDSILEDSSRMERIAFDKAGNIVHRMAFMTNDTMVYDDRHFITRQVQRTDAPKNVVITYDTDKEGNLIQVWHGLKHRNWQYDDDDLKRAEKDTVKLEIDGEGRIIKQRDSEKTIVYQYTDGKLMRKEAFLNKSNDEPISATVYTYNGSKIKKIEHYRGTKLREKYYYSAEGLLDSTEHVFEGRSSVRKYRYSFFDN